MKYRVLKRLSFMLLVMVLTFSFVGGLFADQDITAKIAPFLNATSAGFHPNEIDKVNVPYKEAFFPAAKGPKAGSFLLDLSHGAYFDFAPTSQFSSMISTLQGWGFTVNVANDFSNLMNYDVVLISLPQNTFSAADVQLVSTYLDAGKVLILQGEWGSGAPWHNIAVNGLLVSLNTGVTVQSSMVYETYNFYVYNYWVKVLNFTNHCLNDYVTTVLHPLPSHLQIRNIGSVIYYSSNLSYLDTGGWGPFVLAAIPDPAVHPNWKMFIIGDTNPFSSYISYGYDYFHLFDNAQLFENVVYWCPCYADADCDDGVFCNGAEFCDPTTRQCEDGAPPCADDGLFCNGIESCDEANDQCSTTGNPCPDDGLFCTGTESCDEANDLCTASGDPCPDDGLYCSGIESCDEASDTCTATGNPCPDDGAYCNGVESCNETNDQCDTTGNPCPDDGVFCNGIEGCDETGDTCTASGNPCPNDGAYCNGDESCDEINDLCLNSGDPCIDDGLFCNGDEVCNEFNDSCESLGDPCSDDGVFCNGDESCDEDADQCVNSGDPCFDDGLFCNGNESCDETSQSCVSSGDPCVDDGLFCNGDEICDEDLDSCVSSGDPCEFNEVCDETADACNLRDTPDDDDSGVSDDDDDDSGEEDLWPEGSVSGGSDSSCCGC